MAANITIRLTDDQQRQFREATGQTVTELTLEPAGANELSDQQLDGVVGGSGNTPTTFLRFDFKLVAVKTISWSSDTATTP